MGRLATYASFPLFLVPACGSPSEANPAPDAVDGVYAIGLTASTPSALPKCTSALSGTIGYVATPSSLWACAGGTWHEIPCTSLIAGTVAYASSTQTLLACVSNTWTPVALPKGATGPAGPTGATGPSGAPGATGAVGPAGATGADGEDGTDGQNGERGADGTDGKTSQIALGIEPPGSHCADGGERIDVWIDDNGNGVLDTPEIRQTGFVCGAAPAQDDRCSEPPLALSILVDASGSMQGSLDSELTKWEVVKNALFAVFNESANADVFVSLDFVGPGASCDGVSDSIPAVSFGKLSAVKFNAMVAMEDVTPSGESPSALPLHDAVVEMTNWQGNYSHSRAAMIFITDSDPLVCAPTGFYSLLSFVEGTTSEVTHTVPIALGSGSNVPSSLGDLAASGGSALRSVANAAEMRAVLASILTELRTCD